MDAAETLARRLEGGDSSISFERAQALLREFYLRGHSGSFHAEFVRGECRFIDPTVRVTPQQK